MLLRTLYQLALLFIVEFCEVQFEQEAVMGYFTLPYPHLPGGLRKTTKVLIQVITFPAGVRNGNQKPFSSSRLARWWPGQALAVSRFQDDRHMKVVRSALRTGRHYPPGNVRG